MCCSMNFFHYYIFGGKKHLQILLITSFIFCLGTYFFVTSILPQILNHIAIKKASTQALGRVTGAKSIELSLDDINRLSNTPVRNSLYVNNYKPKVRAPQTVSLLPKVTSHEFSNATIGPRSLNDRRSIVNVPNFRLKNSLLCERELKGDISMCPEELLQPRSSNRKTSSALKQQIQHMPTSLATDVVTDATTHPNGIEDSTGEFYTRDSIIAQQDFEYLESVEADIKKQALKPCVFQDLCIDYTIGAVGGGGSEATSKVRDFVEPEDGRGVVTLIFKFHRYQDHEDNSRQSGGSAQLKGKHEHSTAPNRVKRRFNLSSSINSLLSYIESHPSCPSQYKACIAFPKRQITRLCDSVSILEWGISSSCVIDVEIDC